MANLTSTKAIPPSKVIRLVTEQQQQLRQRRPLVLCLTNTVAKDISANLLLAMGMSPLMSQSIDEAAELVTAADAISLNIGTLHGAQIHMMLTVCRFAKDQKKPVFLDPVGAGLSRLRNEAVLELMASGAITSLRGNGAEVVACANLWGWKPAVANVQQQGVDGCADQATVAAASRYLVDEHGLLVAASGITDLITSPEGCYRVEGGHRWMTLVTGLGCGLGAVCAGYASEPSQAAIGMLAAHLQFKQAGYRGADQSSGPGSFRSAFMDAVGNNWQEQDHIDAQVTYLEH